MYLHEYQAKEIFRKHGFKLMEGYVADDLEKALNVAKKFDTQKLVVKAQIHSGGRGKAGGVKVVSSIKELEDYTKSILGKKLTTSQNSGEIVNKVYIEKACDIQKEFYISFTFDRKLENLVFIVNKSGGVDVEHNINQDNILKVPVSLFIGIRNFHINQVSNFLQVDFEKIKKLLKDIYDIYIKYDCTLIEINPLVVDELGDLVALDAKISIDDNALYRQSYIETLKDFSNQTAFEIEAAQSDIQYVKLDGDVGCIVNGAGLAMATMDIITQYGGKPANFLDVGGGVNKERFSQALNLVLGDKNVKSVLVNIFGGIVRCDLIAQGIVDALQEKSRYITIVVRFQGTNLEEGKKILKESNLDIIYRENLDEAVKSAFELVR